MCKFPSNIPILIAICTIRKSKTKREAKHNSARKLLEFLYKDYLFSEQREPENKFKKPVENDSEKIKLYKWTGTCERCYQRGHKPVNFHGPKRNNKFVE